MTVRLGDNALAFDAEQKSRPAKESKEKDPAEKSAKKKSG